MHLSQRYGVPERREIFLRTVVYRYKTSALNLVVKALSMKKRN
jgi:hypothetical protein